MAPKRLGTPIQYLFRCIAWEYTKWFERYLQKMHYSQMSLKNKNFYHDDVWIYVYIIIIISIYFI